jgi:unsaturated chondroitin disaccharide hydrolase
MYKFLTILLFLTVCCQTASPQSLDKVLGLAPDIPNAPRDASAAAVAASGMIELSRYAGKVSRYAGKLSHYAGKFSRYAGKFSRYAGKRYREKERQLLDTLCSDKYLAQTGGPFLLRHSTGHMPNHSEIDVPIIYADYYLLEALWRLRNPD